jgi:hypothetical protein
VRPASVAWQRGKHRFRREHRGGAGSSWSVIGAAAGWNIVARAVDVAKASPQKCHDCRLVGAGANDCDFADGHHGGTGGDRVRRRPHLDGGNLDRLGRRGSVVELTP